MKNSGIPINDLPPALRAQVLAELAGKATGQKQPHGEASPSVGASGPPRLRQSAKGPNKTEAAFAALGLPRPVTEFVFAKPRRWRFDYAWPDKKVALEVEGGVWTGGRHTRGKGFLDDMEKYNCAAVFGWRVVRCTPETLETLATVEMIKRILEIA